MIVEDLKYIYQPYFQNLSILKRLQISSQFWQTPPPPSAGVSFRESEEKIEGKTTENALAGSERHENIDFRAILRKDLALTANTS